MAGRLRWEYARHSRPTAPSSKHGSRRRSSGRPPGRQNAPSRFSQGRSQPEVAHELDVSRPEGHALATAGTVFVDRNAVMYVTDDDNAGLYVRQYEPASS
jgi:hypothetical protein